MGALYTKRPYILISDKTKERRFRLLEVVNCQKVNILEKLMKDVGYLTKFCLCKLILGPSPVPVIETILLLVEGGASTQGKFTPCF